MRRNYLVLTSFSTNPSKTTELLMVSRLNRIFHLIFLEFHYEIFMESEKKKIMNLNVPKHFELLSMPFCLLRIK